MTEPGPFTAPPVPVHLAGFPTAGGLVVPYVTLRHRGGKAALGLVRADLTEQCLRERRCGVCANPLEDKMVLFVRGSDLARDCTVEPATCPRCAAYTRRACPMIGGFMPHYRKNTSLLAIRRCGDALCTCRAWSAPSETANRPGAPAEGWYAFWTRGYRLVRDPEGRPAAGFAGIRPLALRPVQHPGGPRAGSPDFAAILDSLAVLLAAHHPDPEQEPEAGL